MLSMKLIIVIIIIIIFLKSWTVQFHSIIVFLKAMFECVEARCSFNFFGNFIPQTGPKKDKVL